MMDYRFQVNITKPGGSASFRVSWLDMEKQADTSFEIPASRVMEERLKSWKKPGKRLAAGQELFKFLDGSQGYFTGLLEKAGGVNRIPLVYINACRETEDWPFELAARGDRFLVPRAVHLVRCVSRRGVNSKPAPESRPLKLLFMACSAHGVSPDLDFEKEEETIFKVTGNLAVHLEVEDSGSLEGLKNKLALEKYDILHLTGHAAIDAKGKAFFVMEDETGCRRDVYAEELYHEALIENMPRLVFLSGCHTGETREGDETVCFCRELVEEYRVPAVLGWGREVSDSGAAFAAEVIYRELSRGKSILDAVRRAREDMAHRSIKGLVGDWLLLRLFADLTPLTALVKEGQEPKPKSRVLTHAFLKNSRVKILEEGFVGRRRPLQRSLAALNRGRDKTGVSIMGAGGLGKSCLAGKICERFPKHGLIIVHGVFNAVSFEEALREGFEAARDKEGLAVLDEKVELTARLSELCVSSFRNNNYLILLDDFEQNLEGAKSDQLSKAFADASRVGGRFSRKEPPWPPEANFALLPEAKQLLLVLLQKLILTGKMTQLIITCRYGFKLEYRGVDLAAERLEQVYLASFLPAEQVKKVSELRFIHGYPEEEVRQKLVAAGSGNPRLMEWMDRLVEEMGQSEVKVLLEKVKGKKEEFIKDHVLRELLRKGGAEFGRLLGMLGVYRAPVLKEGVKAMGEKGGLKEWEQLLARGVGYSVVEFYAMEKSYGVTPLLREELVAAKKNKEEKELCHRAGMEYFQWLKQEKEKKEDYDPVVVEELIYHALGSGEEEIAAAEGGGLVGNLTDRLAFMEAQRVGEWILREKKVGLSSGQDAKLLNNLGYLLDELGDKKKAIGYYEQALAIWKKVYGEEHTQVAIGLNNLGEAFRILGEAKKAIGYYEQALAIDEKVYGKEHPDVAIDLNNLGAAYDDLGEKEKAIGYFEQALAIDEKVYGKEHPKVAIRLNNLGAAYSDLGEKEKAIGYYEQALAIDEKVYGKEHPNVAIRLNNLGAAYDDLGEKEKAIGYYEQALAIDEKVYGKEHPNVAYSLNNLGAANFELGRKDMARTYFEASYAIKLKFYGKGHPSSKTTKEWLDACS
jgi:tetratricopeptide (TPR) repeat protein